MTGNFVPMNSAGEPIASYSKMGLGDNQVPLEREFGGAPFAGIDNGVLISKMLQGIRSTASAEALAKTAFIGVCVRSRDDSRENQFDVSAMVAKAGLFGTKLSNLGTVNTATGINQMSAFSTPPSPLIVKNFNDIRNALGYSAALGGLSIEQKSKISKFASRLSSLQAKRWVSSAPGTQVQNMVECAGLKNEELVAGGTALVDPLQSSTYAPVWGLTSGSSMSSQDYVFGSMVYNSLLGQAGSVSLEMGGYDYHDNTRTNGDSRDLSAGVTIGRILESAKILNRPVFLYVTSDGAVVSADSTTRNSPWVSDFGLAGASYIFCYLPSGRPQTSSFQIGHFTDSQAADDKFIIGNSPQLAAQAVFANYLKLNNQMAMFQSVITSGALGTDALNQVVKFA
jgi:hypothetical protein